MEAATVDRLFQEPISLFIITQGLHVKIVKTSLPDIIMRGCEHPDRLPFFNVLNANISSQLALLWKMAENAKKALGYL